ncbi:hypothetical protein H0H87_001492 [Tephrocybe sp. NHM501043]|nr:hypothetical protein H0H87_001492 [Tephrocybe sp. NHM501043]
MNLPSKYHDDETVQDGRVSPVDFQLPTSKPAPGYISFPLWAVVAVILVQASLVYFRVHSRSFTCPYPNPQVLYSPAQEAVEYKAVKFHSILHGGPPDVFDGPPSPELDAAWENIYNFGISKVGEAQASQLVNYTTSMPHDPSAYLVGIDVFHQLHCLNTLRKYLYPDYYVAESNEDQVERNVHISHCLNSVRQSLQCSSDISTVVWSPTSRNGIVEPLPRFDVLHSCKDFDKIKEWAWERRTGLYTDGPGEPQGHGGHGAHAGHE